LLSDLYQSTPTTELLELDAVVELDAAALELDVAVHVSETGHFAKSPSFGNWQLPGKI